MMSNETTQLDVGGGTSCYECGDEYHYLGRGSHDGVCPACGSQLVSIAGRPEIEAVRTMNATRYTDDGGEQEVPVDAGKPDRLDIHLTDQTSRTLVLGITIDWDTQTATPTRFEAGDGCLLADHPAWGPDLVPTVVVERLADANVDLQREREDSHNGV